MKIKKSVILFASIIPLLLWSFKPNDLPLFDKEKVTVKGDWLLQNINAKAQLYKTEDGLLVFSNGIISRTFKTEPNCATVSFENLTVNEEFLRSVRPEAEIIIDGINLKVGGLEGQPIHNYLTGEWINNLKSDHSSFKMKDYQLSENKKRFDWKKRRQWMPKDMPWPVPGKELTFKYKLDNSAIEAIANKKHVKKNVKELNYLKNIVVKVHYVLYDNMPVISKWITVENGSGKEILIKRYKSEILAAVEPATGPTYKHSWMLPNITIQTDYDCGGGMHYEVGEGKAYEWTTDSLYSTQVDYSRNTPCLLVVRPQYGPAQTVKPNEVFTSHRVWEELHSSRERERKGLEQRRMFKALAPWVTENPIMMHARYAKTKAVKKVIDQCAETGFEMVILTFGSGINMENTSKSNIQRMKMLSDYAHSKGVTFGGYSLLASRKVGGGNDVVSPPGMHPTFGNSPCLCSRWGMEYFQKLYNFIDKTDFDVLEHDGSYPGDVCASTEHPGHKNLYDSRWNQFREIKDFYHWCRANGVFLNVPDWYIMNGSNKVAMGYRETNWSLPREQQEIIERQNIYDGTWFKSPSMGWMHVPLMQYHGGGEAATLEPLHEHIKSYEQRLADLFGAGVQAAWRGKELYDNEETKNLVKKWVDFYKKHRRILDGDIIHIRRPDGRDYDAILHVDPTGDTKGLLMVYNPLEKPIKRKIKVNMYYTGLKDKATVYEQDKNPETIDIDCDHNAVFDVEIPAHSQTWFVIKE